MARRNSPTLILVLVALVSTLAIGTGLYQYGAKRHWWNHRHAPAAANTVITTTNTQTTAQASARPTARVALPPKLKKELAQPPPLAKPKPKPKPSKAHPRPKTKTATAPRTAPAHPGGHAWRNWGAAPYAKDQKDALGEPKLGFALNAFVATGKLPERDAAALHALVRQRPEGTGTDGKADGKHAYLTPDYHLDLMMTGGAKPHVMQDVTVARLPIGHGVVKAAEAIVWAVTDYEAGYVYVLIDPLRCGNWSLVIIPVTRRPAPLAPPPEQPLCYTERVVVMGSMGDVENHFGFYASMPKGYCAMYRILHRGAVLVDWQSYDTCVDLSSCDYDAVRAYVNGRQLRFKGSIRVPPACRDGCVIEKRLPREWAASTDTMILECLIRDSGTGSCGVMVEARDYHATVARIFYSRSQIPGDWGRRKLYWLFVPNPVVNCPLAYQP